MAKLFKTSEPIYEFINKEWENSYVGGLGCPLKVVSTTKSKQMLKLSKASKTTEYLIHEDDVLTLVVYEEAFDRLDDLSKLLLIQGVFSLAQYDSEKEKLSIDNRPYADLFVMRHNKDASGVEYLDKYDNALELSALAIAQIEEEEKAKKEAEKEAKRLAKEAKKLK